MLVIDAEFRRLEDLSLVDVYDEIGTYVIWCGKAIARPSYIGEGEVLRRFADHLNKPWATRPLAGTMALFDGARSKSEAQLVEAALLAVADLVDRYPVHNKAKGRAGAALYRLLRLQNHNVGTIRIVVSGQDPLLPPEGPAMRGTKWIVYRWNRDGSWQIVEHGWNRRS
jgi:hypothetical protein